MVKVENKAHKNPECANFYHENPPNRLINRFFKLNSLENKIQFESKAVNKALDLRPDPNFLNRGIRKKNLMSLNDLFWNGTLKPLLYKVYILKKSVVPLPFLSKNA